MGSPLLPDRTTGFRHHLEGEMERRQILAAMLLRISEWRHAEVVRSRLLALVDARIEIDEVPAGFSGRLHDDFDVTLAIEGADVAAGRIIVDQRVDIGSLAP